MSHWLLEQQKQVSIIVELPIWHLQTVMLSVKEFHDFHLGLDGKEVLKTSEKDFHERQKGISCAIFRLKKNYFTFYFRWSRGRISLNAQINVIVSKWRLTCRRIIKLVFFIVYIKKKIKHDYHQNHIPLIIIHKFLFFSWMLPCTRVY